MKLTESQINHLRAVLLTVERRLDEISELCEINEKQGILYLIKNSLNEQKAKQVQDKITDIKKVIEQLTKQLNLKKEKRYTKRIIVSYLSVSWADLCSIESKEMKAYGDVDESVKMELDPLINQLIKSVDEIVDLINSN